MPNTNQQEPETLSAAVARRLRGRMGELQIKGTDIAQAIGMTQGSFSRRYTGSAAWELDELEQLQIHYPALSIAYLLGLEDPAEPAPLTGSILRIEPAPIQQDPQQHQQQQQFVIVEQHSRRDRALFTGSIPAIA